MNNKQKDEYIELQRVYIQITLKRGHSMEELEALKKIEDFEKKLPCNKETEILLNGKFVKIKTLVNKANV